LTRAAARAADQNQIRIGTYGADYVHVVRTEDQGQFDFLAWGALQDGGWGALTQRAEAFVGELGWQPPVSPVSPWFSAGYSLGSGDSNPNDHIHGTFFQIMPTPRPYARFPFYNMMNNEDFYGSAAFRLPRSLAIRSELHALRLASARDLWYGGGGAFQPSTFGYTRPRQQWQSKPGKRLGCEPGHTLAVWLQHHYLLRTRLGKEPDC
jgi:hypothetical protein